MGRHKIEGNKNLKSTKPIKVEVSTEPKKRGRQAGISIGERPKAYIYIDEIYRIDLSDGMNKTVQKYTTKTRMNDGEDEQGNKWKAGDKYQEWTNVDRPFQSTFKSAFNRIHELMVLDGIKEREIVFVNEFMKLYKEKYDYLVKKFESMFDEEQNLRDKKKIKGA